MLVLSFTCNVYHITRNSTHALHGFVKTQLNDKKLFEPVCCRKWWSMSSQRWELW